MQKKQKPGKKAKIGSEIASQDEAQLLISEREFAAKGNYRQLIEVGKALKKQGNLEVAERLPRYYLLRALELSDKNMPVEGAMVLDNITLPLIEIADESHHRKIILLYLQCGKTEKALRFLESIPREAPESSDLLEVVADFVVLDEGIERALPADHPLFEDGRRIVSGMKNLHSGNEAELDAALHRIPLRSPFRYWKLLIKGLSLFYRNADEESAEYLKRIPPESAASAPAAVFLDVLGQPFRESDFILNKATIETTIRRALDPNKTRLADVSSKFVSSFQRGRLADMLSQAETLFQAENLLTKRQSTMLSRFVWTALTNSGQRTFQNLIKTSPRLVDSLPDDGELNRARAIQADQAGYVFEASDHWASLAGSLLRKPPIWLEPADVPKACALIFLRAARLYKEGSIDWEWGKRDLRPEYLEIIEDYLEQAYSLYPELRALYDEAIDVFSQKKPKLSKWYRRLHQAFPDNEDAIFAAIDVDIESGAIVRSEKEINAFLRGRAPGEKLPGKLIVTLLALARKQFQKKKYDAARRTFSILLDSEGVEGHVRLKYGCLEYALGFREKGNSLIDEALQSITPPELGLFQAMIEMKRFGAPVAVAQGYRKELLKRIKAKAVAPGASIVALHFEYLTFYPYPCPYQDIEIVLDLIRILKDKPLPEADLHVIVEYLEAVDPPQIVLLREILKKSIKSYPGDPFLGFLNFFHVTCQGRTRVLTLEERKKLEKWAERLRQGGNSRSAQRIHHFLNLCQQSGPLGGGFPPSFEEPFGRDDGDPLGSLFELLEMLPPVTDPAFEEIIDGALKAVGLPKDQALKAMLTEMKRLEGLAAGKAPKKGRSKKREMELFDEF